MNNAYPRTTHIGKEGNALTKSMLFLMISKNDNAKKDLYLVYLQGNKTAYPLSVKAMARYMPTQYLNKNSGHDGKKGDRNGKKGDRNGKRGIETEKRGIETVKRGIETEKRGIELEKRGIETEKRGMIPNPKIRTTML